MRAIKASVVLIGFAFLLLNPSLIRAAAPDQSISGTFIAANSEFACDRCLVTLLALGVRPFATTYLDLAGHFTFRGVPRGSYTIHAEIDGYEDVNQPVEVHDGFGVDTNITILLVRKAAPSKGRGDAVVDVSEYLDRYPRKAVDAYKKGSEYRKKKKNDEAMKWLETAVQMAPDFYQAHNDLGIVYKAAGRTDDAEREFLRAHEINQTSVEPLLNLTTLYLDENKPDRAVSTSEEAVKTNSRSAPAFFNLGIALYKAAMLDRAEAALKRALELAPKMASVRLMLANVYLKLRRYDKVVDQLNTYIAENPHGEQLQAVTEMRDKLLNLKEPGRP